MRKLIVVLALAGYTVGGGVAMRDLAMSAPHVHHVNAATPSKKKAAGGTGGGVALRARSASSAAPIGVLATASVVVGEVGVGAESRARGEAALGKDLAELRALPTTATVASAVKAVEAAQRALGRRRAMGRALAGLAKATNAMVKTAAPGGHRRPTKGGAL